jgi:capsule synthesis protein PGA_cap
MDSQMKQTGRVIFRVLFVMLLAFACLWVPSTHGQPPPGRNIQAPTRDWAQDMQMKITEPFTLASVGDMIILRPASNLSDPSFQGALKIVRDADVGFGNFESLLRDETHFQGPLGGMFGTKEVAADVKAMGFQLVNRAGNHLMDSNQEGLFETLRYMEQAGLVYAGAGKNLDDARAPHYYESPKGRIGVVGMYGDVSSGGQSRLAATYRVGNTGGKPGLNPIGLTRSIIVSRDQIDALKKIRDSIYEHRTEYSYPLDAPANEGADQMDLFGVRFIARGKVGQQSYAMNPADLQGTLRSIRNGKEYADFMIATIHAHQGATELQQWLFEDTTPDYLIALAHGAIDSGADAFVGHGPHVLAGVEIYKGKPIFYNLGEFFREWDWGCDCDSNPSVTQTPAERSLKSGATAQQVNYESVIAVSKYDHGKLQEVRLYPIDGGYESTISRRGVPHLASPEVAQRVLQRLQKLSEPFGTKIAIDGHIGVIRAL